MARILVVDDEPSLLALVFELLQCGGHQPVSATSPEAAWRHVSEQPPDLVLADLEMPAGVPSGLKLLQRIREHYPRLPVVMISGEITKDRAIQALRSGAADFIEKPFEVDELLRRINNALLLERATQAVQENVDLKKQLKERFRCGGMVGSSPAMEQVFRLIERVAVSDVTVLVLGESGTGKELVAQALHYNSRRAAQPFIAVNCAALPEQLLESELFGHRKGAFTGAAFDKVGLLQAATGGTIFLDEIGSMPLALQSKLLRFLQEKEIRRVGDTEVSRVDVRVVAATNESLEQRVQERQFREDLYYRLSVIPVTLPPLRQRTDDIPLLAAHFLQLIAKRENRPVPTLGAAVLAAMHAYDWPGNVRELQNALERAAVLCESGIVQLGDLPERVIAGRLGTPAVEPSAASSGTVTAEADLAERVAGALQLAHPGQPLSLKEYVHRVEVEYIQQTIRNHQNNRRRAAKLLGVSVATLSRKLNGKCAALALADE